jgi:hypothetical protein
MRNFPLSLPEEGLYIPTPLKQHGHQICFGQRNVRKSPLGDFQAEVLRVPPFFLFPPVIRSAGPHCFFNLCLETRLRPTHDKRVRYQDINLCYFKTPRFWRCLLLQQNLTYHDEHTLLYTWSVVTSGEEKWHWGWWPQKTFMFNILVFLQKIYSYITVIKMLLKMSIAGAFLLKIKC